jgi:hypothetical protein
MNNKMNLVIIIALNIITVYASRYWSRILSANAFNPNSSGLPVWYDTLITLSIVLSIILIILSHTLHGKIALMMALIPVIAWALISFIIIPFFRSDMYKGIQVTITHTSALKGNNRLTNTQRDYICKLPAEKDSTFDQIEEFYAIDKDTNILLHIYLFSDRDPSINAIGKINGPNFESHIPLDLLDEEGSGNAKNCFDAEGKTIHENYTIIDSYTEKDIKWSSQELKVLSNYE